MTGEPLHRARRAAATRWAHRLCVMLAVVLSAGCASSTPNPFEEGDGGSARGRQLNIWVRSTNRLAVEVTLLGNGGQRSELGRLEPRQSETFQVRWQDSLIRARVETVGGRRFTTKYVLLTTQVSIIININDSLNRTTIRAN